jgi:hypothetical protein
MRVQSYDVIDNGTNNYRDGSSVPNPMQGNRNNRPFVICRLR